MLKTYHVSIRWEYDGEMIDSDYYNTICTEEYAKENTGTVKANGYLTKYLNGDDLPFRLNCGIFRRKKFYFQPSFNYRASHPLDDETYLIKTVVYKEINLSMNDLMKLKSDDVITYLKERGITTCPMIGH